MPLTNPDPLRYPGSASTTGGSSAPSGADTSSASSWLQQQPWYRDTLAKWGNPQTLSLGQRGYLARTAQQAGMNPSFGISPDGTVEDWSTPMGAKIALAAFAAWAGGAELGLLPNGSASAAPTLEQTMNAGVDATTAGAGPAAAAAGGGGATATIANLLKVGAPVAAAITNRLGQPSGSSSGVSSLDPALMARLSSLLDMAQQRVASAQPVHDAAMQMALRMAPTGAPSPRVDQAIANSANPLPTGSYSASTLAALRKMAGQ